jgi:hypothetical protein
MRRNVIIPKYRVRLEDGRRFYYNTTKKKRAEPGPHDIQDSHGTSMKCSSV